MGKAVGVEEPDKNGNMRFMSFLTLKISSSFPGHWDHVALKPQTKVAHIGKSLARLWASSIQTSVTAQGLSKTAWLSSRTLRNGPNNTSYSIWFRTSTIIN